MSNRAFRRNRDRALRTLAGTDRAKARRMALWIIQVADADNIKEGDDDWPLLSAARDVLGPDAPYYG